MIIASVIVAAICWWVIHRFEPEGPALKLLWVIFFSCIGNIIFFLLFGDFTKSAVPAVNSLEGLSGIPARPAESNLPPELK